MHHSSLPFKTFCFTSTFFSFCRGQFSQFQVPWYDNLGKATASSVGLEGAPYRDLGRPSSRSAMIGLRARTQSRKPAVVYHNSEEDLFPDFKARYALSSRIWLLLHTSFALST